MRPARECASADVACGIICGSYAPLGPALPVLRLAFEQCAMGAGAVTVTSARMNSGVRFSWPHMHTSLGVIFPSRLQQTQEETNPWVRAAACCATWGVCCACYARGAAMRLTLAAVSQAPALSAA